MLWTWLDFHSTLNLAEATISHRRGEYEFTQIDQCISGKLSSKFCACYLFEEENVNFKNLSKRFYLFIPAFIKKFTFFLTYFFKVSTNLTKRTDCNDLTVSDDAVLHGFGAGRGNHTAPVTVLATRSPCSSQDTFYIIEAQSGCTITEFIPDLAGVWDM